MVTLFSAVLAALAFTQGCGGGGVEKGSARPPRVSRESIYGEVIEVLGATDEEMESGIIGWIGIEGARSQAVEGAVTAVTGSTRIVDRRSGHDVPSGFDAVAPRQTVEASFEVLQNSSYPYMAVEIIICP